MTTEKDTQATNEAENQPEDGALEEALDDQESADMWAKVDAGLDGDEPTDAEEEEPDAGTETKPAAQEETPPAGEAEPDPQAAEPTPSETPPEPEPEPQKTVEPEPEPEPEPQVDVDQLWSQRETALVDEYAISEEEANAIIDSPQEHLPKMLAKAQARAERMIWENLNTAMPDLVDQVLNQKTTVQEQEDRFMQAWPEIKEHVARNPQDRAVIERMRDMFTKQPGADKLTEEQVINQVGAAAMISLGIKRKETAPGNGQGKPVTTPTQPKSRTSGGRRGSQTGSGKQVGAFEQFDEELDNESGYDKGSAVY